MAVAEFPAQSAVSEDEIEEENRPRGNNLKLWGNLTTMNLNNMIYTNIQQSPYFKSNLIELKTYHEVIDEIFYKVEPWERGSRRIGSQTGMCGGVRGVGTGGIVSTAYCLLYKLYTLKLTRKQLKGLLEHPDSPYIRGLGFMYIRYCLPPEDLWIWYAPYLDDTEEIDVRAGGGCVMTIGAMLEQWLTKLDWFSTLFPRIPVPVQKKIEEKLRGRRAKQLSEGQHRSSSFGEPERPVRRVNRVDPEPDSRMRKDRHGCAILLLDAVFCRRSILNELVFCRFMRTGVFLLVKKFSSVTLVYGMNDLLDCCLVSF
ncbi:unnamed protein product [Dibothriocephalus latus]|uniref:Pre-mRNA-splicing factor 38 n=1 Tax=Dibothriocephalus latus TaxID=60516 RepID=A0A3P6PW84_DIBLA|nr:unnamed protein product [Dibothriocephalus latus]